MPPDSIGSGTLDPPLRFNEHRQVGLAPTSSVWPADGASLTKKSRERRHKLAWQWTNPVKPLPPFAARIDPTPMSRASARSSDGRHRGTTCTGGDPFRRIVGMHSSALSKKGARAGGLEIERPERFDNVNLNGPSIPARVSAKLNGPTQRWVAAELNGVIAGLGRPYETGAHSFRVSVMLSPRLLREGKNRLAFYEIDRGELIPLGARTRSAT